MGINPTKLILGILTPLVTAASGWLVAAMARYGIHLDPTGIVALGTTGATAGAAAMVKLIHDAERGSVGKVLGEAELHVTPVLNKIQRIDPAAKSEAMAAIHALEAKMEAMYAELLAKIPQPPATVQVPVPVPVPVSAETSVPPASKGA